MLWSWGLEFQLAGIRVTGRGVPPDPGPALLHAQVGLDEGKLRTDGRQEVAGNGQRQSPSSIACSLSTSFPEWRNPAVGATKPTDQLMKDLLSSDPGGEQQQYFHRHDMACLSSRSRSGMVSMCDMLHSHAL